MTTSTRSCKRRGVALGGVGLLLLPAMALAGEGGDRDRTARTTTVPWLLPLRGSETDAARSVAVAPDGSILVAGSFEGDLPIGADRLESAGDGDGFLIKLDRDGRPLWAQGFGGPGVDGAAAVVVDAAGNATVVGTREGALSFSGGRLPAGRHEPAFALSFSPGGQTRWVTSFGARGEVVAAAALMPDGGLAVVGSRIGSGPDSSVSEDAESDGFLTRLAPGGEPMWTTSFGGQRWDQAHAVGVGHDGTIWVAGSFAGSMIIGTSLLESAGGDDGFVASFAADGRPLGGRRLGGIGDDAVTELAITEGGSVAVAGRFEDAMRVGSTALTSAGDADLFVAVLERHGVWIWSRRRGGAGFDAAESLVGLRDGSILVAGEADGADGRPARVELARYRAGGAVEGELAIEGPLVAASALAAAGGSRAVLAGWFLRDARVAGRQLRSHGDFDGLVLSAELGPRTSEQRDPRGDRRR